jgi:hypothetical protein
MKYATLAEMKSDHKNFFNAANRKMFRDFSHNKRGDCLIVGQRQEHSDHSTRVFYGVWDFAQETALNMAHCDTFQEAEQVAQEVNEIGRQAYLEKYVYSKHRVN